MMTHFRSVCLLLSILFVSLVVGVAAQTDREAVVFSGELTNIEPSAWGSGNASLSDEEEYLDRDVLEIDTKGFHEGGRLTLKQPLALSPYLTAPEKGFLVLTVRVHQPAPDMHMQMGPEWGDGMMGPDELHMDPGAFPPGAGPMPGGPPGWDPAMGPHHPGPWDPAMGPPMEDMPGMEMMPGMEDMPGMMGQQGPPPPMVTQLRALLVTDKGQIESGAVEIIDTEDAVENWQTMVIPLAGFAGDGMDPTGRLQHIALFGNADEKFWVATVKLVSESQPLVADAGQLQRTVKVNREVEFEAAEQAGGVSAQYVWDFDDWDGIGEDSRGRTTTWCFPEPGYYVVTLTVSDRGARKLSQTTRVHVKVED